MYDIHVGDRFASAEEGEDDFRSVTVVEIFPLENKIKYEYESGTHRTLNRIVFLEQFPVAL